MDDEIASNDHNPEIFEVTDSEAAENSGENFCYKEKVGTRTNYIYNRFNFSQLGMMVDFMTLNPNLIRGTITPKFSKADRKVKWEELAALLNSDGLGVQKSAYKWNKCWNDLKTSLKQRASRLKQQKAVPNDRKSGNYSHDLNELETRVLKMIGYFENRESCSDESEIMCFDVMSENSNVSSVGSEAHQKPKRSGYRSVLLHRSDPSSADDDSILDDKDEAIHMFDDFEQSTSGQPPKKKVKILHHPYFRARKEADLIAQMKRQNEILDRIAGSVERIEKALENFTDSSQVLYKKSGLLENIAVNMERLAETFVIASMSLKKLSEK